MMRILIAVVCLGFGWGVANAQQRQGVPAQVERETVYSQGMVAAQNAPPVRTQAPPPPAPPPGLSFGRALVGEISTDPRCKQFRDQSDALLARTGSGQTIVFRALIALQQEAIGAGCAKAPGYPTR